MSGCTAPKSHPSRFAWWSFASPVRQPNTRGSGSAPRPNEFPESRITAEDIADLYRMRWQVDLAFKSLKSLLNMDALRAKEPWPEVISWTSSSRPFSYSASRPSAAPFPPMGARSEGKRSLRRETVWILAILEQAVRGIVRMRSVAQAWKLTRPHLPKRPRKRRMQRQELSRC
jgi:hypothetical protein